MAKKMECQTSIPFRLLVISHFQTYGPLILTPLRTIAEGNIVSDHHLTVVQLDLLDLQGFYLDRPERQSTQSALIHGNGNTEDHLLLIEDPYEQPDNAARAVSMSQLPSISEAFEKIYHSFVSSNQDRNSLIYGLVGRRVSSQLISSHGNPLFFSRGATDFRLLSHATPPSQNQFCNRPHEIHQLEDVC
ncbi:hypothetical protein MKW98_004207 [Papaver atlanticum]|uniref:Uncharacterized protein n=1 Tax=Papaver atlanticum TaxID=357466 RepID=A0AAD4T6E0_9MAGN|nr:hypothetical protein MKW98_004207 [Papaver atlanticum]